MIKDHSFIIYNASAGSGKTFTIVKEYLKIIFKSNKLDQFKNILAITFTNKAVAEMKSRIIDTLKQFSSKTILENPNDMFTSICKELEISHDLLHKKSKKILTTIVYNYAAFEILTIDGFIHRLIRTFAYDLKLPLNFEVELDQHVLLSEAVANLISKAGTDSVLTETLIDFAIEKADEDKSWDVSFDFNKISKILVNENDKPFLESLKGKTLNDFKLLKSQLRAEIKKTETDLIKQAEDVLDLIEKHGLKHDDFLGKNGFVPSYFVKLKKLDFSIEFDKAWMDKIKDYPLYPKANTPDNVKDSIDEIQPQIATVFEVTKKAFFSIKFLKAFYKNITPLSVLNAINNELKLIKEEKNKILISEFNTIISKEIKDQPTPFIYERLGEKFKYYFIDEFQDTSVKQWENLIPLLSDSLSSENASTMLVGDAKQAIYRWRGGKAEQFINLFNKKSNPFVVQQTVKHLNYNYRSFKEIIAFNNGLFKYVSNNIFANKVYQDLYEQSFQKNSLEASGYVELSFLEIGKEDDRDQLFSEHVLKTIHTCLENEFRLEDICVLVRKKKEGIAVANFLSQNKIPIVSSETLLICKSLEVLFIVDFLSFLIQPKDQKTKIAVLNYLIKKFEIKNKHDFFINHIDLSVKELFNSFKDFNVFVDENLLQLSLYDLVETIVRSFSLVKTSNAYVQFFLDVVLEFSQKTGSDISAFLEYFNKKKESLSIVSPKGINAVQIMTIHKSKGLEFPVVIFPFADLDIYKELEPKEWFPLNKEKFQGFTHTLLNYNKDFKNYGKEGFQIYNNHQSQQELDNINLLYVALTRAVEQLYVISKKETFSKKGITNKKYSGLLINYLNYLGLWQDSESIYKFGSQEKLSKRLLNKQNVSVQEEFILTSKEDHNIKTVTKSAFLWDTKQQDAIEKGNLIHDIMSKIKSKNDVNFVIKDFLDASIINIEQANSLKEIVIQIISHTNIKNYFESHNYIIYNEQDILTKEGIVLRPDRIVINNVNEAVIIDYKTGAEDKKHLQQLQTYQDALEAMKIKVKEKLIVYVNDGVKVKSI